ncbi:hypothetical protein R1flu_004188 [Riccia fluitans]|uniref:Alpha-1,3-glucosyltransferase n=1 Tax=Riccia fluitans TaxID=41844 RepID=A0ABD1YSJ8_9MARC
MMGSGKSTVGRGLSDALTITTLTVKSTGIDLASELRSCFVHTLGPLDFQHKGRATSRNIKLEKAKEKERASAAAVKSDHTVLALLRNSETMKRKDTGWRLPLIHQWKIVIEALQPEAVALHTSRGFESPSSKMLMRWTVLSSDVLLFFPAVLWFINEFYSDYREKQRVWALAMVLLHPALMLIDHGHFQYNCISLGLAIAGAAAVVSKRELWACVLFSLSLNHKPMSTYYAPAFFAHLLGRCFQKNNLYKTLQVLSRLAPMQRGIYEDYVANFWCGTAMVFKWKQLFPMGLLAKLALGTTVSACLPSMVQQIYAPSRKGFLYSMLNCSFAFYFFSYQVHEKSVLLPIIPASLLAIEEPQVLQWKLPTWFVAVSVSGAAVLHLMYFRLHPPRKYPFLFEALIMAYTFAHFVPLALYTNWKQWLLPKDTPVKQKLTSTEDLFNKETENDGSCRTFCRPYGVVTELADGRRRIFNSYA